MGGWGSLLCLFNPPPRTPEPTTKPALCSRKSRIQQAGFSRLVMKYMNLATATWFTDMFEAIEHYKQLLESFMMDML